MLRSSIATLLCATCLALPGAAAAHGRLPASNAIVFHPSDPDQIVVRTTFGLLVSGDGGATFRWVCFDAIGNAVSGRVLDSEDPALVVTPEGTILAGIFDGLARGEANGCAFGPTTGGPSDTIVIDVALDPGDPARSLALTSRGGVPNGLYASTDDGRTFTPIDAEIDRVLFETVRIAPSMPSRVYLAGATGRSPNEAFIYRSNDGGASFDKLPFALDEDAKNVRLLGVDPLDPDRLFARIEGIVLEATVSGDVRKADDRLVRSDDGGETWTEVLSIRSLLGFAISVDGAVIWAGGDGGLHRSFDHGATFEELDRFLMVRCLAARGDELWVCADEFADAYSVGRSTDEGTTITPVLRFRDVQGIVTCDEGGTTPAACQRCLFDLVQDLSLDPTVAPDGSVGTCLDAGTDGGFDAADVSVGSPRGGGCDCAVGSDRRGWAWLFALVGLLWLRRRHG